MADFLIADIRLLSKTSLFLLVLLASYPANQDFSFSLLTLRDKKSPAKGFLKGID